MKSALPGDYKLGYDNHVRIIIHYCFLCHNLEQVSIRNVKNVLLQLQIGQDFFFFFTGFVSFADIASLSTKVEII